MFFISVFLLFFFLSDILSLSPLFFYRKTANTKESMQVKFICSNFVIQHQQVSHVISQLASIQTRHDVNRHDGKKVKGNGREKIIMNFGVTAK